MYDEMESRKSIFMNKRMESSLHNSPTSSSPLRRKSINVQKQQSSILSENDDEAERIARRREIYTSTPLTTNCNKRHSLGLGFLANIPAPQMAESISKCIKLSAENKITIKNAFSLEMIDFMTYMIKKQDDNMSNLQIASTSLDVSTKIYGFRVDSVHTEILKIVGGLDKQAADDAEQNSDERGDTLQGVEMNDEMNLETQKRKKKKKKRQRILSTVEALRGNIEILKPTSMMIGEGDLQTSDMLYQAMLPNHANSGFYQHLYNDVIVDVVEKQSEPKSQQNATYTIPMIEDFRDLEICTSYSNFEFLGWSVENEPKETPATPTDESDRSNNGFQFDLDASVEQVSNLEPEPINYFDMEHENYNEKTHEYYQRQATANRDENIVDANDVLVTRPAAMREYSFVLPNVSLHWAGPSHWKFRNPARPLAGSVAKACHQAPMKRRREIKLSYDENRDVLEAKFVLSQSNKLQAKTAKAEWSAESLTLPEDVHYDIGRMIKLYLHENLIIKNKSEKNDTATADLSDGGRYDYNNPNDTLEYCPDVNHDDYEQDRDDNDENECNFRFENDPGLMAFTGDNLVAAPKLANKITIAYCLKAKKVDMRQLKKSIWNCLKSTCDLNEANIKEIMEQTETSTMKEAKQFSNVYKILPKLLTKNNAEALSVPLSFISLLHLANEKSLKVYSLPDMSDVIAEGS